jgi:isopentenyldiphosphate isomerase
MSAIFLEEEEAEAYQKSAKEEMVDIVDEDNHVVECRRRADMRELNLPHRATYAFIRDSAGYFYVQKRSSIKDYCPSYWDPTPGGVVAAGESYEYTNRREVEEEMGIPVTSSNEMEHLFTFYYEDMRVKCHGDCWELIYDGPIKLQITEVEECVKMSMSEILARAETGESFTPDSMEACKRYVKMKGCPEVTGEKIAVTLLT